MSDSKGAAFGKPEKQIEYEKAFRVAIEKILWGLYNDTPHQVTSHVPKAKQAILAILAQEVKRELKDILDKMPDEVEVEEAGWGPPTDPLVAADQAFNKAIEICKRPILERLG